MDNSSEKHSKVNRRNFLKFAAGATALGAAAKFLPQIVNQGDTGNDQSPSPTSPTQVEPTQTEAATTITPAPETPIPTKEGLNVEEKQDIVHTFQSLDDLNSYVASKELDLGWSTITSQEQRFGDDFLRERSALRPSNKERTVGFVVSDKFITDLKSYGEDAIQILTQHVEYLNQRYEEAGISLKYSLTDIMVLPDTVLGPSSNIRHKDKDGIQLHSGRIPYPRYQDSTWVINSDCNDADYPNYAEKLNKRFSDLIDKGLIHELIHHTGIGDLYQSQKEFGSDNTPPITRYIPDALGFMAGGEWKQISPWEAFFINKLIENNTFSPQHDNGKVSTIFNSVTKTYDHYLNNYDENYNFIIQDRNNANLVPKIDGFYSSDHHMDATNHNFLTGDNFEHNSKIITLVGLSASISQDKDLFVLKSNSSPGIWLPIDRHFLALLYLNRPDSSCLQYVFLNPDLPQISQTNEVHFDVIQRSEQIPTELDGNPVYGYSEINEELRGIWHVKQLD